MCGMPDFIAKGQFFGRIDKISRGPDRQRKIAAFLEDLCNKQKDYVDVLVKYGVAPNKFEECHLRQHWFPQCPEKSKKVWWKDLQPIEPVARKSMILAFEIALERDLPVDVFWLCRPGDTRFDATVTWNETQVNRFLFTPPIPEDFEAFSRGPNPKNVSRRDIAGIFTVEQADADDMRFERPKVELIETRVHPPGYSSEAVKQLVKDYEDYIHEYPEPEEDPWDKDFWDEDQEDQA